MTDEHVSLELSDVLTEDEILVLYVAVVYFESHGAPGIRLQHNAPALLATLRELCDRLEGLAT